MRTLSSTYESIEGVGCIERNFAFIDSSVSSGAHFTRTFSALVTSPEHMKTQVLDYIFDINVFFETPRVYIFTKMEAGKHISSCLLLQSKSKLTL